jgi:glycosyl transferase family 2
MKLICTMPVRNEDWCLGLTARAALMWCDELVVWLHACTDGSRKIISQIQHEYKPRVIVGEDQTSIWREMAHRKAMLEWARLRGATHIAMVDADEILTGNLLPRIRDIIELHCERGILNLPWLALARDPMRYINGPSYWGERQNVTTAFKDRSDYYWAARDGYDFHQRPPMSKEPNQFVQPLKQADGGLMHLQFLSERRLRAKQALYQMTEVLRWPGRTTARNLAEIYGRAVYDSNPAARGVTTARVPDEWWAPYLAMAPAWRALVDDKFQDRREPWQETEVRRLLAEHGREKFAGLDLFGL